MGQLLRKVSMSKGNICVPIERKPTQKGTDDMSCIRHFETQTTTSEMRSFGAWLVCSS